MTRILHQTVFIFIFTHALMQAALAQGQDPRTFSFELWQDKPQKTFSGDIDVDELKWRARVLLIFAQSPYDPKFIEQMALLERDMDALTKRDLVIVTSANQHSKQLRNRFHPRGFSIVLIDKDGLPILRKPKPWSVRELSRAIDKTPIRQQELRAIQLKP